MVQEQTSTAHVDNVSTKIVKEIAELEDVSPLELASPLYEAINPDALDQIFASTPSAGRMEGQVTFSYNGYEVTVWGDGSVSVQ